MSAWIKTSVSKIAGGRAIYAERATSGSDIVKLDSLDDTSKTNAFITVRNDAATLLQVRGSKTINDNKWHLITGVKNGTSVYLYVDGAQDGTTDVWAGAENFTNAGIVSLIAADALGPSFTGAIDDVRIYTRALGRDEVQQLYHLGAANAGHSNENFMSEGLVGYWTFDGNTINWRTNTFNDISGNGNNATTTTMSTSTSPVAGKIGQALKFNASGYLTISDSASLDPTAAVSMSVWANTNVVANGQVISKYNALSSSDPYEIQFWNDGEIYGNFSTTGGPISVMHCPYAINTWYHIVATYDGIRAKLYLNGKPGGSTPFNGTIDDVRIYNRALSAGEVAQLYKAGR